MKIQYASDLHLEFEDNIQYFISNPLKVTGDILILAGDIHVFGSEGFMENPFWDWASKNYKQVIIAYGNHEYYKECDLSTMKDGCKYKIRDNVYYYYNCVITIDDIDIIVSTLWSYINKENELACQMGVNDFRLIKYNGNVLTPEIFNNEHKKCLDFIKKIGGTNCICNQLGYVMGGKNENDNFSSDKCIDLKNDNSKCDMF